MTLVTMRAVTTKAEVHLILLLCTASSPFSRVPDNVFHVRTKVMQVAVVIVIVIAVAVVIVIVIVIVVLYRVLSQNLHLSSTHTRTEC